MDYSVKAHTVPNPAKLRMRLAFLNFIAALPLRARLRTSTTLTHCG